MLGFMGLLSVHAAERPNVIMILVDDMGYSDVGAFGGEVRTPHLDALAGNGLRFTQSYNFARCCPSRGALLTGLYPHQVGLAFMTGNQSATKGPAYLGRLNNECITLAEVLKETGYNTYGVGKWHVGGSISPISRGFDEYYGYLKGHSANQWDKSEYGRFPSDRTPEFSYPDGAFYVTDVFNDYALEFIKQGQQKEKPFFLYLAHSSPHFPLHAPPETRDSYLDTYRRGWDVLRKERYERQEQSGLVTDSWRFTERSDVPRDGKGKFGDIANGYSGQQNPAWDTLDADRREDLAYRMATFAAMIEHVDRGVGRMVAHLKETGDLDNTLILFTSDNGACYEWGPFGFDEGSRKGINTLHKGEALRKVGTRETHHSVGSGWSCLSNTPFRMYKHFNYEGGNSSPLIAHWPAGIEQADRWVRSPVNLIDMMPTICSVSGATYPEEYHGNPILPVEGISLKPLFDGAEKLPERTLFFEHVDSKAIRQGDWKLVSGNKRYKSKRWELYHLGEDRCETKDLIQSNPEKAQQLEALWNEWAVRVKVYPYHTPEK